MKGSENLFIWKISKGSKFFFHFLPKNVFFYFSQKYFFYFNSSRRHQLLQTRVCFNWKKLKLISLWIDNCHLASQRLWVFSRNLFIQVWLKYILKKIALIGTNWYWSHLRLVTPAGYDVICSVVRIGYMRTFLINFSWYQAQGRMSYGLYIDRSNLPILILNYFIRSFRSTKIRDRVHGLSSLQTCLLKKKEVTGYVHSEKLCNEK